MAKEIIGTRNGQQFFVGQDAPAIVPPAATTPAPSTPAPAAPVVYSGNVPSPSGGTGPTYQGANGQMYSALDNKPIQPAGSVPTAPAAPRSPAQISSELMNSASVSAMLTAINNQFSDELAKEDVVAGERSAGTNAMDVARGLAGSPQAEADKSTTSDLNAKNRQAIQDRQSAKIAEVLGNVDSQALKIAELEQSKYETDYTNWKTQKDQLVKTAQDQLTTLASSSSGSWADFAKAAPDTAQKLIDQTGYDPNIIPFIFNNAKTKAQQITWDSTPLQNPDGTLTLIGHDPTKTGPDSIVRQKIDTAPDGMTTTVVGGLPYWKDSTTGALYPVPSEKGQMITLKDSSGTNYLYNTYTKQFINPLGADTSGGGQPSPNAPASPLDPATSTLNDLMSYYVNGSTGQLPGAGYMGAIYAALGPGAESMTLAQLKDKIPQLISGVIKAEGSPILANTYHNGGAMLWSTAKAYGFDTLYNATPVELNGSNGQKMTYAAFPDDATGTQALQSYFTSLISGNQSGSVGVYNGWSTTDATIPKDEMANTPIAALDNRTPNAITQNAIAYALQGGNLQQFVGGLSSKDPKTQRIKNAIDNKASALAAAAGTTLSQLRMDYKNATAAQKDQVEFTNQVSRALNGAEQGATLTQKLFTDKGINTADSTWVNATLNDLIKKFGDSGDIRAYHSAMVEIGNEYAQVFARGGQRSVEGNKIAQDIIDGNVKLADIQKTLDTLQAIGKTVIDTSIQQMNNLAVPDSLVRFNKLIAGGSGSTSTAKPPTIITAPDGTQIEITD